MLTICYIATGAILGISLTVIVSLVGLAICIYTLVEEAKKNKTDILAWVCSFIFMFFITSYMLMEPHDCEERECEHYQVVGH